MNEAIHDPRESLHPKIQDILEKRGFDKFSEIQMHAVPKLIQGDNAILIAPTGTGKTESALLPIFHRMLTESFPPGFTTLYITPLRSLNRDMMNRLVWWGNELGIRISVRHGDTTQNVRRKQAAHPPDLLITTPESLQAMMMGKILRKHLSGVRFIIVDEIHELAGSKRGAQLSVTLERLVELSGEIQRIGISATVGNPNVIGLFLCGKRPCTIVQIPVAKTLDLTVQFGGESFADQTKQIEKCIDSHTSTLVFVNTRNVAEAIGHALRERGDIDVHHGSLSYEMRVDAEDRFRAGLTRGMINTSSMELGIDIGQIDHVVQFNSPREVTRLIQRIGRAGHQLHATSRGTVLATGFDDSIESMVIVRRAMENEPESVHPPINAADVVANQIAAIAVERGEIAIAKIEEIFTRSYCFSDAIPLIHEVIAQMERHFLIRIENELLIAKARTRKYLSQNLSMISDEKKSVVFDIISQKPIGTLDESFVVSWLFSGVVFVTRGRTWRVLDIDEERIMVEPAKNAKGELPLWDGEKIPVPFAIAMEVGQLRRLQNFDDYHADKQIIIFSKKILAEMIKNRSIVATDKVIVLEDADEGVMLNLCGGHKVNETLGRVLSILLSARYGTSVGVESDAYRIFLRLPKVLRAPNVNEVLCSLEPDHIETILTLTLKKTTLYKWKLIQVAKKFGAIDTNVNYEKISINRLLDRFEGTAIEKETLRELFFSNMDVENARLVVQMIKDHRMETVTSHLSIIGADGFFTGRDLIMPPNEEQAILSSVKHRIDKQDIVLACMHCKDWKSHTEVGHAPDNPQCPICGARLIAVLKPYDEKMFSAMKKKNKNTEEKEAETRMIRNANMVLSSGKKAIIALAGRGVGPDTAARILNTFTTGDNFYREILKAERRFVQTHRFWSD
ncbi:MAG: DEAD/DEAH box helicase [Methanocalculaceae archaeon]|jgi:ATP-dependent Lhr-like helicase|nr:DEAD/DEAH box helicase [Methanocalculaceae archaeon]